MNHSVTVGANKGKFIYVGFLSECKSRNRFRVMTFDKPIAAFTVAN